ncbi:GNAT family N-acetyltransferase [Paeniglutamicibacter sp.]|uniref:GNAT family N-acetyltransferase n=1 Tax=Paeniglutamicibacter sp. TaxID=1934391 RepID=UPI0039898D73
MLPNIEYSLSYSAPTGIERDALSALALNPDARWHERMDHALFVVTALHEGTRVGLGIVHNAVTAPTEAPRPMELGGMFVHPAYRRLGIRQYMAEARLTYALSMGGTPITVIDNRNHASWGYYERSPRWTPEREYTGYFTGLPMTIWVSTESSWHRTGMGLAPLVPAQPNTVLPQGLHRARPLAFGPDQDNAVPA